jgi:hypothetical protein
MGLLTLLSCFIVFIALIRAGGTSEKRLRAMLLTKTGTGLVDAIYAVAQSFGIEPFVSRTIYTFPSPAGPIVRVCSTLGHSNYLGNFLLYTTLTTAAFGFAERGLMRLLAIAATGLSIAAIIVLAFAFLVRARRRVREPTWRIVIAGIVSSFAAVIVHNVFIFDQVATSLCFFAFLALAQVTQNVVEARKGKSNAGQVSAHSDSCAQAKETSQASQTRRTSWGFVRVAFAGASVVVSIWYAAGLSSEAAYKDLLSPANPVDYDGLVRFGDRITSSPLPTGAYDYLFGRGVDDFIRKLPGAEQQSPNSSVDFNAVRAQALTLAIEHVEKSLADTFTPEMNYSLLGTLALASGDVNKLRSAATAAVNSDPNNYLTRWLMAEAYMSRGENGRAASEAEIALNINPASLKAASTLARARGLNPADEDSAAIALLPRARNARSNLKQNAGELVEAARKTDRARTVTASLPYSWRNWVEGWNRLPNGKPLSNRVPTVPPANKQERT